MSKTKWYSALMKTHHINHRTDEFLVYHLYYTGKTRNWIPSDLEWGYVGVSPYATTGQVFQRYLIERMECDMGSRDRRRKVIQMFEQLGEGAIAIKAIKTGLTKEQAYVLEEKLRPEGHNCFKDRRIWNEIKGGASDDNKD